MESNHTTNQDNLINSTNLSKINKGTNTIQYEYSVQKTPEIIESLKKYIPQLKRQIHIESVFVEDFISNIQTKQSEINHFKEELNQAKKRDIGKKEKSVEQIQELKSVIERLEQEKINLIFHFEKQIEKWEQKFEDKLNRDIINAQETLANSLKSADKRIREYNAQARLIQKYARKLFYLDLWILGGMILVLVVISSMQLPLFEKLGVWSLMLLSFPVIIILTIAITLLRHHKKLLDEVRHYSAEKRQIELYSGLLKASQYAAASLNNSQESAEYVKETFTAIRNRILSEQPHNNTAASASEKEDYDQTSFLKTCVDITNKAVDIISKNSEKK